MNLPFFPCYSRDTNISWKQSRYIDFGSVPKRVSFLQLLEIWGMGWNPNLAGKLCPPGARLSCCIILFCLHIPTRVPLSKGVCQAFAREYKQHTVFLEWYHDIKGKSSSKVTLSTPRILKISGLMCDLQDTDMPMDTVLPHRLLVSRSRGVDYASTTSEQLVLVARTSLYFE